MSMVQVCNSTRDTAVKSEHIVYAVPGGGHPQ